MTIETLEYIYAAYKCGSYKEAAFMMSATYSVVAKQVARAEEELGVRIFERASKSRQMELTPAGEFIMERIGEILDTYNRMRSGLEAMNANNGEHVSIGYGYYYPCEEELEILAQYCDDYPKAVLSQVNAYKESLRRQLAIRTLDGIFDYCMIDNCMTESWDEILRQRYQSDEWAWDVVSESHGFHFLMGENNPLAGRRQLTIQDAPEILKQKIIRVNTDNGKKRHVPPYLARYLQRDWEEIQTVGMDGSNLPLLYNILKNPNLLYPTAKQLRKKPEGIVAVPVADWNATMRLMFVWSKDNTNPGLIHFRRSIRHYKELQNRKSE